MKKPSQLKNLVKILSDGEVHLRRDLINEIGCKGPPVLNLYLGKIRKTLTNDEMIVCELVHRAIGYRLVKRYIPSS